jgi:fatty-acyl-CoA synthase
MSIYAQGLAKAPVNHVALTPLGFLERTAFTYPNHLAVIHGPLRRTWAQTYARCRRLASALAAQGIGPGDTVATLLPNIPPMLEAHFGVPMLGAVLNTLNVRLDAAAIAYMLRHGQARALLVDREFAAVARAAVAQLAEPPLLIDVEDPEYPQGQAVSELGYEALLAAGDPDFAWQWPVDEWDAISLNYTSGTTGNPKGVVYHHRGAFLNAIGNQMAWGMPHHPVYLWTLPMFHCNGWCFPWTLALTAGTHVCLRWVRAKAMYDAFAEEGVTHLCGAPVVMSALVNAPEGERRPLTRPIVFNVAGAPPPEAVIRETEEMGFTVNHIYGLTETYGPAVVNEWHEDWDRLDAAERAAKKARQGVRYAPLDDLAVLDPQSMQPVPADGETLGEVMFRGNIVIKGYLKNPEATREAFEDGWFHSGDLGVLYPDGYIQLKDRSKDIIISGGENISSIEVENALYAHPSVLICAVVAHPHPKWGETPVAYVELKPGASAEKAELIAWSRQHLAHYKCPTDVVFTTIPRTSTGKVQKFRLREASGRQSS